MGRPCPHDCRHQVESRFVHGHEGTMLSLGFLLEVRPPLLPPLGHCLLVLLHGLLLRLLSGPSQPSEQPGNILGMRADPEVGLDQPGHPRTCPHLSPEPKGLGPLRQHRKQPLLLLGTQTRGRAWQGSMPKLLYTSFLDSTHPLADGTFTAPQRFGDIPLFPPLLGECPGAKPTSFTPILRKRSFLRHTSNIPTFCISENPSTLVF